MGGVYSVVRRAIGRLLGGGEGSPISSNKLFFPFIFNFPFSIVFSSFVNLDLKSNDRGRKCVALGYTLLPRLEKYT